MTSKTKKTSGTEKRKKSHLYGVRLDDGQNGKLLAKARHLETSPTSTIRAAIAHYCGHIEPVETRRSPRRSAAHVPAEILELGKFVSELRQRGNNFNQTLKEIHTAKKTGDVHLGLYVHMSQTMDDLIEQNEMLLEIVEEFIRRPEDDGGASAEYL